MLIIHYKEMGYISFIPATHIICIVFSILVDRYVVIFPLLIFVNTANKVRFSLLS
jgi:hypothetical protein